MKPLKPLKSSNQLKAFKSKIKSWFGDSVWKKWFQIIFDPGLKLFYKGKIGPNSMNKTLYYHKNTLNNIWHSSFLNYHMKKCFNWKLQIKSLKYVLPYLIFTGTMNAAIKSKTHNENSSVNNKPDFVWGARISPAALNLVKSAHRLLLSSHRTSKNIKILILKHKYFINIQCPRKRKNLMWS